MTKNDTLIERKVRVCQLHGVQGEAVISYCKPWATQEMACHRLSRRVHKMEMK
ncbi:MAG: hypothetical protein JRG81_08660 [Deltaproteobacteria bacterium]|nr:hypothetical protein [Deltaproteobacteria bacterium]